MTPRKLKITNARENNLKEVSLDVPHDRLVVLTGLSGSGKSSLAFDTVYAEGQRRYIETFSPYTRQFFDKVKKPDVDVIENVRPAVAIQQRTRITNSRSTVGSMTNVNDYLKILWSNLSTAVCPQCGVELRAWSPGELADHLAKVLPVRGRASALICAPLPIKRDKKTLQNELDRLKTLGYSRYFNPHSAAVENLEDVKNPVMRADGALVVVLDRVKVSAINQKRLRESIEQAFVLSDAGVDGARGGTCLIIEAQDETPPPRKFLRVFRSPAQPNVPCAAFDALEFHNIARCPAGTLQVQQAKPALFSYNHPIGACPECKGFGKILQVDPKVVVPNPSLSIKEKALQCWAGPSAQGLLRRLAKFCDANDIPTDVPWRELSAEQKDLIFDHRSRAYVGVRPWFKRLERKSYKMHVRVFLAKYRGQYDCPACNGTRVRAAALAYRIKGRTLPEIWDMTIGELLSWTQALHEETRSSRASGRQIDDVFTAIVSRLQYLNDLGLTYLTLNRQARTLSGGETQRVNLAAALGSELISTHFVLDEPSVGLHARDSRKLIESVRKLQQRGNSLLVVEHDLDFIHEADDIVELGPRAGAEGGEIVYNGPRSAWRGIEIPPALFSDIPAPSKNERFLKIRNAAARNLKNIDIDIPLGRFVSLSGVSGSGKSTLVNEVIEKAYRLHVQKSPEKMTENTVTGFDALDQVLIVDQSPLAKSPRANIATYSKIWDALREMLADSDDARLRALSKSAFSFNVDGGRCPACKGAGFVTEDMQFLSDVYIPCEVCLGKRFQAAVLEVRTHGFNVHELLQMSVEKCAQVFADRPDIGSAASTLVQLGLGHLTLGHPLSELSGGEAQRLKLVPFVEQASAGESLLIFDEPTTGLHFHDVEKLISLLRLLVARGHSVLCIEHNLSLLAACDWIIDLGPEAGDRGGELVLAGSPRDFLKAEAQKRGHTAPFLKQYIDTTGSLSRKKAASRRESATPLPQRPRESICIRGAREHNLKNIAVDVPLDEVVVFTGVSGSGKSSIAKDIIYAEGQRRYLDCLSPYARQYIKELKRPELDEIRNVQPTICVYQHTFQPGRLSTVGTMSEIYNFLRLLYAKTGTQYCPDHPDQAISPLSAKEIAAQIRQLNTPGVRILAPVIKMKKGNHRAVIERAVTSEISELRIDGIFLKAGSLAGVGGGLEKSKAHSIDFTLAKLNPANVDLALIEDVVSQSLSLGAGTLIVHTSSSETVYSLDRTCPVCKQGFFKPDPEDFSFHSKRGQCEFCRGTGLDDDGSTCPQCKGARINPIGRNVRLSSLNIFEASKLTPPKLREFLHGINLNTRGKRIAEPILNEMQAKIDTLVAIGLDYIQLARDCITLSGGELQRLRLATAMGSPLAGVTYIFDEPSVGLHPVENLRVLEQLRALKDRGNSVIIIEHDADSILSGDHVIEVGPGGGRNGGHIVFSGKKKDFASSESITARAIRDTEALNKEACSKKFRPTHRLEISSASRNNIHELDLKVPLHCLTTVAGVSGAGKSTLVHGIIGEGITLGKGDEARWRYAGSTLESSSPIARVVTVDQKPIGLNSRSTPASYLAIWNHVRDLFAQTIEAKARGWQPSFFSYNTGKGRCAECKGQGQVRLEMSFLADAAVQCESCNGTRYGDEALSVHYQDFTIADALNFTFEEAKAHFANHRKIYHPLVQACELGLGYLTLGQSSSTLSGGESQRIKLVSELSAPRQGHTLYILDEPTTGLHKADVSRLVKVLKDLVSKGNSVLLIEHDADVLLQSDYVIELGPGPGEKGGKVIFSGAPQDLLSAKTPWGEVLRKGAAEVLDEMRAVSNS